MSCITRTGEVGMAGVPAPGVSNAPTWPWRELVITCNFGGRDQKSNTCRPPAGSRQAPPFCHLEFGRRIVSTRAGRPPEVAAAVPGELGHAPATAGQCCDAAGPGARE